MAKKKKPDQDSKKGKPEATEELSEMMSMDDDWEILELTERTIVRQAPEDEETISLSPPGMEGNDEDDDYTFISEESGETPAAEYKDPPKESNSSPNDFELELDGDDTEAVTEDPEELEVELEMEEVEEEAPQPVKKETPKKKIAVPEIEDLADFSELEEEEEEDQEEEDEEEEEPAPKKSKMKPAKKKKAGKKGPLIGMVVVLSLVLVALVVVIVLLLQKQPGEPRMASSKDSGQPIATVSTPAPAVEPKPTARPKPAAKPAPASRSIPTPTTSPVPTSRPKLVVKTKPSPEPAAREIPPTSTTTAPAQPAEPVTTQAQPVKPTPPKPTPAAPPAPKPPAAATIVADPNMVHKLSDIDFRKTGDSLQVKIMANGPVGEYKSFPLSSPPRLVIDLPGEWEKPPFLEKKVATGYISRVRLGQHADKLRIVADLRTSQALTPVFTPTRDGLTINLSPK